MQLSTANLKQRQRTQNMWVGPNSAKNKACQTLSYSCSVQLGTANSKQRQRTQTSPAWIFQLAKTACKHLGDIITTWWYKLDFSRNNITSCLYYPHHFYRNIVLYAAADKHIFPRRSAERFSKITWDGSVRHVDLSSMTLTYRSKLIRNSQQINIFLFSGKLQLIKWLFQSC